MQVPDLANADFVAQRNFHVDQLIKLAPRTIIKREPYKAKEKPQPIVKSTPKEKFPTTEEKEKLEDSAALYTIEGVHIDLFDYFDVKIQNTNESQLNKLRFINEWVFSQSKDLSIGMKRLNSIDNKLGNNDNGENKIIKIYNWIKLYGNIPPKKI